MGWAEHVAHLERIEMHTTLWLETLPSEEITWETQANKGDQAYQNESYE